MRRPMNTNVLADSKYHRADVDGILPPCYVIAFPQLSSPTHSNFGVHEPQEEATEAQLNNEYWQKRLLRLQGAHVAGPRAASPFSTSTPEFVMHKMHKCACLSIPALELVCIHIMCQHVCLHGVGGSCGLHRGGHRRGRAARRAGASLQHHLPA